MNSFEITQSITLLATAISQCLDKEQSTLLAAILVQLGDTLITISAANDICNDTSIKNDCD